MTIEDETGFANLVIFEKFLNATGRWVIQSRADHGSRPAAGGGRGDSCVLAETCRDFTRLLRRLIRPAESQPTLFLQKKAVPSPFPRPGFQVSIRQQTIKPSANNPVQPGRFLSVGK